MNIVHIGTDGHFQPANRIAIKLLFVVGRHVVIGILPHHEGVEDREEDRHDERAAISAILGLLCVLVILELGHLPIHLSHNGFVNKLN